MAKLTVPVNINGIPLVLKSLRRVRREFEFEEGTSDEFIRGVYYTMDSLIETLEGVSDDEKTEDIVNHPSHYTDGKIEVIEFIEDKKLGFCLGNAVKYIARAGKKDPTKEVEDLKKAEWYIKRRIKELEEAIV